MNAVVDNVLAAVERTSQAPPAEYVLLWVIAAAVVNEQLSARGSTDQIAFWISVVSRELARKMPLAPRGWVPWCDCE